MVKKTRRATTDTVKSQWSPERCETLAGLYCVRGLPVVDIAEALGVTPQAVRSQVHALGLHRPAGWSRTWRL